MKKIISALLVSFCILSMLPLAAFAEEPSVKPVAWYDFEDAENLGKDKSGNGNDLISLGTPEQVEEGPSGNAVFFDGLSSLYAKTSKDNGYGEDYADVIAASGSKKLTIAYWIKNEISDYDNFDISTWRRIISNGHDGGALQDETGNAFGGFTMLSLADNYIIPTLVNPAIMVDRVERHDGSCTGNTATYPYEEGKWFFIVWTADATTGQFCYYVNGEKLYDQTADVNESGGIKLANTARPFALAANTCYDAENDEMVVNHSYTGALDEVMVFDSILSASDISYYMSATGADLPETTPDTSSEAPNTSAPDTSVSKPDTSAEETAPHTSGTESSTQKPAESTEAPSDDGGVPTGLVIGIVAAVVVIAAVAAVIIVKKKKK